MMTDDLGNTWLWYAVVLLALLLLIVTMCADLFDALAAFDRAYPQPSQLPGVASPSARDLPMVITLYLDPGKKEPGTTEPP